MCGRVVAALQVREETGGEEEEEEETRRKGLRVTGSFAWRD
jgi:hypothetical protein